MEWTAWIPTAISVLLVVAVFVGRKAIEATVEKSVQLRFDSKLEALRSEFRKSEELFKSELHSKEREISSLRDGVLSGRANRQALLDKRRLEAVERVWSALTNFGEYKFVSTTVTILNFEAIAKEAPENQSVRLLLELIGKHVPDKPPKNLAKNERPFVSPIAWALFSAYMAIIVHAYARFKTLEAGIEDAEKYFNTKNVKSLLKTALPHHNEYIDKYESAEFNLLLDELEGGSSCRTE